jgi:hypothetical protein
MKTQQSGPARGDRRSQPFRGFLMHILNWIVKGKKTSDGSNDLSEPEPDQKNGTPKNRNPSARWHWSQ